MRRLLFYVLLVCLLSVGVNTQVSAKNRGDYQLKESSAKQVIHSGKWTTLQFSGGNALRRTNNYRTLFCAKVHLSMPKSDASNPQYLKLRFARQLPDGSLDTTGTNTWVIGKNFTGKTFHASLCWTIDTKYYVSAQVKVVGSANYYVSNLRQFKAWSPPYNLPPDLISPAPSASLDVSQ